MRWYEPEPQVQPPIGSRPTSAHHPLLHPQKNSNKTRKSVVVSSTLSSIIHPSIIKQLLHLVFLQSSYVSSPLHHHLLRSEAVVIRLVRLERNKAAIARYRARNAEAEATRTHAAAITAAEANGGRVVVGAYRVHRLRNTRLRHLDIAWFRLDRDVRALRLLDDGGHGVVGGGLLLRVSHVSFLFLVFFPVRSSVLVSYVCSIASNVRPCARRRGLCDAMRCDVDTL